MTTETFRREDKNYTGLLLDYNLSKEEIEKFTGKKVMTIKSLDGLYMLEGEDFKLNIFDWILKSEDGKEILKMSAQEYSKILVLKEK